MPQAKKSTRTSSPKSSAAFKEPAALKKLNQSLETAQNALTELREHAGGKSSKSLHTGVGKLVASAKRDSGKLTSALKRDFAEAQKKVASTTRAATRTAKSTAPRTTSRATTRRSARKTG
jgi:hypothetical protein